MLTDSSSLPLEAHWLATLPNANLIVVSQRRVAEPGAWPELMARPTSFFRLVQNQYIE